MTKERVDRQGDEKVYQPRIHKELIGKLHTLRERTGLPMTVLVDQALKQFIERQSETDKEPGVKIECQDDYEDLSSYLEPYQSDPFGNL